MAAITHTCNGMDTEDSGLLGLFIQGNNVMFSYLGGQQSLQGWGEGGGGGGGVHNQTHLGPFLKVGDGGWNGQSGYCQMCILWGSVHKTNTTVYHYAKFCSISI